MSTMHIKQLPRELALSYAAGTNLMLLSKPAVGKSETVEATAKTMAERVEGFKLWRFDMTTANPTDLMAYMPNEETHKLECYENVMLPNAYDTPDACGFVFIDEVLNGDPTTVKVFQKYVNGESIGDRLRKPDRVTCIMASNRMGDKAGVMQQSRAFLRRVEQVEVYSDAKHNIGFAEKAGWWPVVIEFMKKFPELIDNYDVVYDPEVQREKKLSKDDIVEASEEGKRGIWANMASWTRISKLEYAAQSLKLEMNPSRFTSNVGKAVGLQYTTFRAMYDKIATVDDILKDPKGVEIPENMSQLFVMVCMLAALVPQEAMNKAAVFIDRLPGDIRAMAIRRLVMRSQKNRAEFDIGSCKEYQKWMQDPAVSDLFMAAR
jgi:MoxR-like ATPase